MTAIPTRPCRLCRQQIGWVITKSGSRMPIDPTPNPAGNVIVTRDRGKLIGTVLLKGDRRPPGVAFMPHHATCPAINPPDKPRKEPKPPPPEHPSLFP